MAFASLGKLIEGTQKTASTTWSPTVTVAATVGTFAIVNIAKDNQTSSDGDNNEVLSVSDSAGNTWTKVVELTFANGGAAIAATGSAWRTVMGSALSTTQTITFNFSTFNSGFNVAKAVTGWRFSIATTTVTLVASTTLINAVSDAGPMDLTGLASSEHLFFRGGAVEGSTTTYTASTNYTATSTDFSKSTTSGAGNSSNMGARGEFRIVTVTSDHTDPTTSADDQVSLYFAFNESTGAAGGAASQVTPRTFALLGVGA